MAIGKDRMKEIQSGLNLPDEKKYYFNGFAVSMSPSDFTIVIQNQKTPLATINASHSVLKSFAKTTLEIIANFEKETGLEISTLEEIEEKVRNSRE